MITMLAATSVTGIIGIRGVNTLLWKSPIDLGLFKSNTKGQVIVMGNNTFKSIRKPLKNRTNIVISNSEIPGHREGVTYYNNIGDIIKNYETFMVIGGEVVYNLFLPIADEIIISTLSLDFEGNVDYAYFPIDRMEKDFYMTKESEIISDVDEISGLPINLIFTRWKRGVPNVH
jgi:dihydrofolate reductase